MIARTARPWPSGAWKDLLSCAVTDVGELLRLLGLPPDHAGNPDAVARVERELSVRVPRGFVARMRPGDPDDPLLLQVLAHVDESRRAVGFTADPVGELSVSRGPLLRKYRGRALLVVTGACAVHCRYCFRRHFPYEAHTLTGATREGALTALAADPSIRELILSGGDPLAVPDDRLSSLLDELAAIPHLRRLRLHTRLPVVIPQRVDEALLGWLSRTHLQTVVVLHVNHANEIDDEVTTAAGLLRAAGATVLNQAVLLAGVNDSVEALATLSEALMAAGILPYYLHLLDPVAGAAHFDVPEKRAVELIEGLRARLPGFLVPRLVREVAGAPFKVPIGPSVVEPTP